MLDRALAPLNRLALRYVGPDWLDYVASNTMTDFNRWFNGFIWTYDLKALVTEVIDEAPGVKTFVLRPNQHWPGMKAGQYIEVILPIDGKEVRRHYSPTPLSNGRIAITVRAIESGQASTWMHRRLRAGTQISIGHPQGRFVHEGQRKVLLLCAGTGITPCRSIVRDLLSRAPSDRPLVQVLAQFRTGRDVVFKADIARWRAAGLKVTTALSGAADGQALPSGTCPRLTCERIKQLCPDLLDREVFLCGPAGFMTQMLGHLRSHGVDMRRVHTERFVSAGTQEASPRPQHFQVAGTEVHFRHIQARVTLTPEDQGRTLLEIAQAHGVDVESGCGQGMCGTCRLTVHEGEASGNVLGKLAYLCTAYPASRKVVLDA